MKKIFIISVLLTYCVGAFATIEVRVIERKSINNSINQIFEYTVEDLATGEQYVSLPQGMLIEKGAVTVFDLLPSQAQSALLRKGVIKGNNGFDDQEASLSPKK